MIFSAVAILRPINAIDRVIGILNRVFVLSHLFDVFHLVHVLSVRHVLPSGMADGTTCRALSVVLAAAGEHLSCEKVSPKVGDFHGGQDRG